MPAAPIFDCCLVIPCYREAERLDGQALLRFLDQRERAYLVLVDDGSPDGTWEALQKLSAASERLSALRLPRNAGKGEAVRQGMLWALAHVPAACLGYADADLAAPLEELWRLRGLLLEAPGTQAVMGARVMRLGAHIRRRAWRHYAGRAFATYADALLGLGAYDTQCGAKVFRPEAAAALFAGPFRTRWLFDLEWLLRAKARQWPVREEPLMHWEEKGQSKLRWTDAAQALAEVWRLSRFFDKSSKKTLL